MFFFLSKTLNYLTQPLAVLILLWVISIFLKKPKWKKGIRIVVITLAILFTNDFLTNEVVRLYETPITPLTEIKKQYEWGIVLTGVTSTNKVLRDRVYVISSPDRVNHSFLLYKKGIIRKILISGGSGQLLDDSYSEARELYGIYRMMGVDSADLLIEGQSRNTHESAVAVKEMMEGKTSPSTCLLITSAYHMPRSAACFRKIGWTCDTFSTDIRFHQREFTPDVLLIPKADALLTWNTLVKEWVGLLAYKLSGYI
jgi:uncharacterized SAM-binding protein YcdF (DUF218 family)